MRAGRTPPELTLPATLTSVRRARRFVRVHCAEIGVSVDVCDEVLLLASELVTNAVLHGRSDVCVEVGVVGRALRVAVLDDNSRRPAPVPQDPDALDGRGLALVAALASSWGVDDEVEGKAVWFELPVS